MNAENTTYPQIFGILRFVNDEIAIKAIHNGRKWECYTAEWVSDI